MAVPALGYGILTLAIASKRARLWWAATSWGLGLGAHMLVWKYSTVKSEFETREPFCLGGIQFHLGQKKTSKAGKKSSKTFVNLRKGKLTAGTTVDCHLLLLSFFSSWWKEPLVGSHQDGLCGAVERGNSIWPCHQVCRVAQGLPLGIELELEPPILCPTTTQIV